MTKLFDVNINLAFNDTLLEYGIKEYITWNPAQNSHLAISGSTGSGKTYMCSLILGNIAKFTPHSELIIADFKGTEFTYLQGYENYFAFEKSSEAINKIYKRLLNRQSQLEPIDTPIFLYIDELASLLNYLSKKESEQIKQIIANILMLGRSLGINLILSQQRLDASFFGTGARENISVLILLGNCSKEVKSMFFKDCELINNKSRGTGVMLLNQAELFHIKVPQVRNISRLQDYIKSAVFRTK